MKKYIFFVILVFSFINYVVSGHSYDGKFLPKYAAYSLMQDNSLPTANYKLWKIKNGKFYFGNKWIFLKVAKPLIDFSDSVAVNKLISEINILKKKNYNAIEINCYWHHFDLDGDGIPDKSLKPLNKLINTIYSNRMCPCLSVEIYAVGGGTIPFGFWKVHPDAIAIDNFGKEVSDTEYGFGSKVVSIFNEGYRNTVHKYIQNLAKGINTKKILYFETTVEPQYMGARKICYSESARKEYEKWRTKNSIIDENSKMPVSFPIPESFVDNPIWNKFRAQFLAKWVNDDAAAYRSVAGKKAYVAVDYLDADEKEQIYRDGNPEEFLMHLTAPNIIQINWSWYFPDNKVNQKAYDRIHHVMKLTKRDWALTEHMTFNGSDFNSMDETTLNKILENTLHQGTRFGWEFVSVTISSTGNFSLYNDNWSPKRVIGIVDNQWSYWLNRINSIEYQMSR